MIRSASASVFAALVCTLALGCDVSPLPDPPNESIPISPDTGGTVTAGGATLNVPAGAVSAPVTITVRQTREQPPAGYEGFSPVYQFEPEGLQFATPAEIRIAFTGDPTTARLFWTTADGSGYEALPFVLDGQTAVASVSHFSKGFVGRITGTADGGTSGDGVVSDPATSASDLTQCPDGGVCTTDGRAVLFVFHTAYRFTGNLGGVAGADQKCQAEAQAAGVSGTFRAWISDDTPANAPATRFSKPPAAARVVYRTAKTNFTVASDWTELTSGALQHAISNNPTNQGSGGGTETCTPIIPTLQGSIVWTNTKSDGTTASTGAAGSTNCNNWTTEVDTATGRTGSNIATDATWTDVCASRCNGAQFLYCVQQYL